MADHPTRELIDDLDALLDALPAEIVAAIHALPNQTELIEVVLDLGRVPEARFPDSEVILLDREFTEDDIALVVDKIGTTARASSGRSTGSARSGTGAARSWA